MGMRTRRENSLRGTTAYNSGVSYVVEGNTVRSVRADAALRAAHAEQERRRKQQEENAVREERVVYAEKQRAMSMDLPFLMMLTVAIAATVFIVYNYLSLQADIDQRMASVKKLEVQLENLRTENDALEQSIDTSVDLNYIYKIAVNELGMVHAGKDNVIQYSKTESEYVRQNEDIPEN